MSLFKKATKAQAKLRCGIAGPAGSGKTLAALALAKGIGGKIAVIDTERGSASLYSSSFDFDTLDLKPPYTPERFIEALKDAEANGYNVVIIDSATHEWDGMGGCLEINEALASTKFRGNTWSAWNETTPRHRAFLDAITASSCHVICTARSKTETVQGEDKKVRKVGMKVEQRAGFEYEMTLMFEIDHASHKAVLTKGRLWDAPTKVKDLLETPHCISPETGKALLDWLNSGAPPSKEPQPQPEPKQASVEDWYNRVREVESHEGSAAARDEFQKSKAYLSEKQWTELRTMLNERKAGAA